MSAANVAFARALQHRQAESLQEAHAACLEVIGHDESHIAATVLACEILLHARRRRPRRPPAPALPPPGAARPTAPPARMSPRTSTRSPTRSILRGEMSLVGPRPLVADEDEQILGMDRRRLQLTPGMTGHWQILGSSRVPLAEMVKLDYLYVRGGRCGAT